MAGMNVWTITGNLTRDPELRSTPSGTEVCNMAVAVNGWKDGDVEYVDVSVWGKAANACAQHLEKGAAVAVSGRCKLRTWEKKDGSGQGAALTLDSREVTFLGKPGGNGQRQAQPAQQQATPPAQPAAQQGGDDDIPF